MPRPSRGGPAPPPVTRRRDTRPPTTSRTRPRAPHGGDCGPREERSTLFFDFSSGDQNHPPECTPRPMPLRYCLQGRSFATQFDQVPGNGKKGMTGTPTPSGARADISSCIATLLAVTIPSSRAGDPLRTSRSHTGRHPPGTSGAGACYPTMVRTRRVASESNHRSGSRLPFMIQRPHQDSPYDVTGCCWG